MESAIRTKLQVFSPNRILAGMGPEAQMVCKYPAKMDRKERHAFAAVKFARENSCFGLYVAATNGPYYVWVPVPDSVEVELLALLRSKRDATERRAWFFNPGPYHDGLKGSFAHAIFEP